MLKVKLVTFSGQVDDCCSVPSIYSVAQLNLYDMQSIYAIIRTTLASRKMPDLFLVIKPIIWKNRQQKICAKWQSCTFIKG